MPILFSRAQITRISHHGSGRAGLQPRRYKALMIIPLSRAPRSPAPAGLRGARDQQRAGAAISAGLKPRPSGGPLRASKRGEKYGLRNSSSANAPLPISRGKKDSPAQFDPGSTGIGG